LAELEIGRGADSEHRGGLRRPSNTNDTKSMAGDIVAIQRGGMVAASQALSRKEIGGDYADQRTAPDKRV
jgi:hypothetical protein